MPINADQKLIRIVRLSVVDKPGYLGKIATRLGELKANIGEITIIAQGPDFLMREISLQLDDQEHLDNVIEGLQLLEGVKVSDVIDPVEEVHQGGKIAIKSRVSVDSISQMRKIYTPGVAQICKLIEKDRSLSSKYTSIANSVAIVTNGTAILGLGHIGPVAGMPVMEGKSVLFEQLVGISAIPILIDSTDVDYIVQTIKGISPTFGAIQLEDIAAPECFEIESRLQKELNIPVLHDDQHATAIVVLAAMLTIANRIKMDLKSCKLGIIGLGAAGQGIARLFFSLGLKEIIGCDLRADAMERLEQAGGKRADLQGVLAESDVVIATTGVPNLIKPQMVRKGQVILALSNPDPEIQPELAIESGASFAADGRTINNALAFPGLFRGALKAGATKFTDKMKLAAAYAIANQTKAANLVPSILDREMHQAVAAAVASAAK